MVLRGLVGQLITKYSRETAIEYSVMDNGFPRCMEFNLHPPLGNPNAGARGNRGRFPVKSKGRSSATESA